MFDGFLARAVMATLLALVGVTVGCEGRSPSGPTPPAPPTTPAAVPQASVTAVSPNVGSTAGGTPVRISGTGFQPGATVTVDGTAIRVYVENGTTIHLSTPAHAVGTVDVVVTNPGGQADRLAGGYTYAPPQSFDFNGNWSGGAGSELDVPLRFTIQDNVLVSVSCGTSGTLTFSPPASVSNGEFSFLGNDSVRVSGRIVSASSAIGTINVPGCPSSNWWAERE